MESIHTADPATDEALASLIEGATGADAPQEPVEEEATPEENPPSRTQEDSGTGT
jgi:hypothetical protein